MGRVRIKKKEITSLQDDVRRAFASAINNICEELDLEDVSASEKSDLVNDLVVLAGASVENLIHSMVKLYVEPMLDGEGDEEKDD